MLTLDSSAAAVNIQFKMSDTHEPQTIPAKDATPIPELKNIWGNRYLERAKVLSPPTDSHSALVYADQIVRVQQTADYLTGTGGGNWIIADYTLNQDIADVMSTRKLIKSYLTDPNTATLDAQLAKDVNQLSILSSDINAGHSSPYTRPTNSFLLPKG